tara:strand:+ start:1270 stop:3300 length:2031 start_codon:yes stop_codon:yes gene_type:complete
MAKTITVGPVNEADYPSIQEAVDQAESGDEILVYPGIYSIEGSSGNHVVTLSDKAITIRSCQGPQATIIDGQHVSRGILCTVKTKDAVIIEGFTIRNCTGVVSDVNGDGNCSPWEANGGAFHLYASSAIVKNCVFSSNSADMFGGAIYTRMSTASFQECDYHENDAGYKGGAMFIRGSSIVLDDCDFVGNVAVRLGGAIHTRQSSLSVSDSTFQSNAVGMHGGALYSQPNSTTFVSNSIFCGNTGSNDQIDHIKGPWEGDGDNCFSDSCEDSNGNGYPDGCDPCVHDATDTDGDGLCDDIDPCPEYPGPCSLLLDGVQVIEVTPEESIQDAIELAMNGDTIELAPGTYYEAIDLMGKAITIRSGFGCVSTDHPTIDATGLSRPVITCNQNEGRETRIIGLTLTGGSAINGGGIYCWFSSPSIEDCVIEGNLAYDDGGGIMIGSGNAAIRRCIIQNNISLEEGGGIFMEYSDAFLEDCHFRNNHAFSHGGGVCAAQGGAVTVSGCLFESNTADSAGGGLMTIDCSTTIRTSEFLSNSSYYNGGGYYNNAGTSSVESCRFESNLSIEGGGLGSENGPTSVFGSVFCDNRDPDGALRNIHGFWNDLGSNEFGETCDDPECPTDINNDGVTDINDILLLLDVFGPCPADAGCKADVNGNGAVDCPDLLLLINYWGPCGSS